MAILQMSGVDKRYGGVKALRGASLDLNLGEVHALLGPNGSGKSTLNKVLAGTVAPDQATITLEGSAITIRNPQDAHRHGIAAVYQQLSLVPQLTVGQNLTLGLEPSRCGFLRTRHSRDAIRGTLERFARGLHHDVTEDTPVAELSPGDQQIVEIAKAVLRKPRFLILDEATASLHRDQVALVFQVVRELCQAGTGIVFVSHRLGEIMELCQKATILRGGETVASSVDLTRTSQEDLVKLLVGDLPEATHRERSGNVGAPLLEVRELCADRVHGVSFTAHAGEVVGLGGLQGQGQSELLLTLFGAQRPHSGTILVAGRERHIHHPRDAADAGVALVPGDRGTQGMFPPRPIQENISVVSLGRRLTAGFAISGKRERDAAQSMVERLAIKIGRLSDPVSSLSGGNAQKVIIAKWLLNDPQVILLDDPTKGVDIGAKAEIYRLIDELTAQGATVVFNSSDDRELAEVSDRVLVMFEGQVRRELVGHEVTYDNLVSSALLIGMNEDEESRP